MAVIDTFFYNGERDILRLHLAVTEPFVDKYIVIEAKTTFTGKRKPLYLSRDMRFFKHLWPKIRYFIVDERYTAAERKVAQMSPNTRGAAHWLNEFLQKESILKALAAHGVRDNDICCIGDVDEIWEADPHGEDVLYPSKLKMRVYAYYLDNRSNEEFYGTYVNLYRNFKNKILNHDRTRTAIRTEKFHGWHFTSMGGYDMVKKKLDDSYTSESYNTPEVQAKLAERLAKGIDYLGRDFAFRVDTSEWPEYLRIRRSEFRHLLLSKDSPREIVSPELTPDYEHPPNEGYKPIDDGEYLSVFGHNPEH